MKIYNIDIDEIYEEVAKNSVYSVDEIKQNGATNIKRGL